MGDSYTQELTHYTKVKTFSEGCTMTDSDCDAVIYNKEKENIIKEFFKGQPFWDYYL